MGIVVIIALVIAAGWWVDVRVHPFRRCPRCNGRRRNEGKHQRALGVTAAGAAAGVRCADLAHRINNCGEVRLPRRQPGSP